MGLLDTQIRQIVSSGLGWLMLDATLSRWTAGTFSAATQKRTGRTATTYAVKGFVDEDVSRYMMQGVVSEATAYAGILQVGAAGAPRVGDHLSLRGTWRIVSVREDPAEAMWVCGLVGAGDEA